MRRPFVTGLVCGALALGSVLLILAWGRPADWIANPLLLPDTAGRADVIVVLGAAVDDRCVPNGPALRRTLLAVRLFHEGRAPKLLFTGGYGSTPRPCPVAEVMAALAGDLGVPADDIVVETRSRSTQENASLSATLLRELGARRVLIVTDAVHMRRAAACFSAEGFEIERASVPSEQLYADNLYLLRAAIHEYGGLLAYRMRGHASSGAAR